MNAEAEIKPAGPGPADSSFFSARWNWKKLGTVIALAFAVHLALILIFGAKHFAAPRPPENVPHFKLASAGDESIALDDPTLFALPHVEDFAPAIWRKMPVAHQASTRWTEPPPYLPPTVETFGAAFNAFMASNQFAPNSLRFKPAPQLSAPQVKIESLLPQSSSVQILGDAAKRALRTPITAPTLPHNDVIGPSRVQVLVDQRGNVVSDVLLQSSDYVPADQTALELARRAQFAPANKLTFGELVFRWHTIPTNPPAVIAP